MRRETRQAGKWVVNKVMLSLYVPHIHPLKTTGFLQSFALTLANHCEAHKTGALSASEASGSQQGRANTAFRSVLLVLGQGSRRAVALLDCRPFFVHPL